MAQFSNYFSVRLGTSFEDYTMWTEPYLFYPSNLLGTTVASPIFDRSVPDAPRLIGVAGIDMLIDAAENAMIKADVSYTPTSARSIVLDKLAERARRRETSVGFDHVPACLGATSSRACVPWRYLVTCLRALGATSSRACVPWALPRHVPACLGATSALTALTPQTPTRLPKRGGNERVRPPGNPPLLGGRKGHLCGRMLADHIV